jgi:ABC-type multidrug transport system fused ATPase/permease subunit
MQSNISLLRAIAAVFLRRLLGQALVVPAIVFVGLVAVVAWLAIHVAAWWWIALVAFIPLAIIFAGATVLSWWAIKMLSPRTLSRTERRYVADFSGRLMEFVEAGRAPLPFLAVRLVFDLLIHRDARFLNNMIARSQGLREDYEKLREIV